MKKIILGLAFGMLLLVTSCSSTRSLQEYYVDNSENPNFISLDIPASVLNIDMIDLSSTQKEAVQSLKKLNILAFKKTLENNDAYKVEKANVKAILKNDKFIELMKMNTNYGKATIKYLGTEDSIDEVIVYGSNDEKGFALVRVLGDNMNPAHIVKLIEAIGKSDFDGAPFEKIGSLLRE